LTVENRGGEAHTFTEVSHFGGGGIFPEVNEMLFSPQNPPLFFDPNQVNVVPPGGDETITPTTLTPGTHLFICAPVDGGHGRRPLTAEASRHGQLALGRAGAEGAWRDTPTGTPPERVLAPLRCAPRARSLERRCRFLGIQWTF